MKNYLKYSLWLTLIVLFALIGMHWYAGYNDRRTYNETGRFAE